VEVIPIKPLSVLKKFLEQLRWKKLARQLRKPTGAMGLEVARRMNTNNEFLYNFTLDEMMIRDNQTILEIGFGNGRFFKKHYDFAENLRVTGIDISDDMLAEAREFNRDLIRDKQLELLKSASNQMPFPDNNFDKAFSINVAYFWNDPQEHLSEIARVLKPGGRLYTTIRSAESLSRMPFSQYGFSSYSEQDWKLLCHLNDLSFIRSSLVVEPDLPGAEFTGIRSFCFVAEKMKL